MTSHGGEVDVEGHVLGHAAAPGPVERALHDVGEVEGLGGHLGRVVAGELDDVADEVGELVDLGAQVGLQLGAVLLGEPRARRGGWTPARTP